MDSIYIDPATGSSSTARGSPDGQCGGACGTPFSDPPAASAGGCPEGAGQPPMPSYDMQHLLYDLERLGDVWRQLLKFYTALFIAGYAQQVRACVSHAACAACMERNHTPHALHTAHTDVFALAVRLDALNMCIPSGNSPYEGCRSWCTLLS